MKTKPRTSGQVVLVLQGGGALGAYQAGVFEALSNAGIEPDWVIGTSIGAINGALIADNTPSQCMPRLRKVYGELLLVLLRRQEPTYKTQNGDHFRSC